VGACGAEMCVALADAPRAPIPAFPQRGKEQNPGLRPALSPAPLPQAGEGKTRRLARNFSLAAPLLCLGCAAVQDAPRLAYECPRNLRFEARLYQDLALLEGQRGFVRLTRTDDGEGGTPRYRDDTLLAEFGLGPDGRTVALHYTGIPETVSCQGQTPGAVRAAARAAPTPPRPPPPPEPSAPVPTNVRTEAAPTWPYN